MVRTLTIILTMILLTGCFQSGSVPESKQLPTAAAPPKVEESEKAPPSKEEDTSSVPVTAAPALESKPEQPESPKISKPTPPPAPPTEQQIKQKYHTELSKLQGYYTGQLSGFYGQAVQDVKAGKSAKALYDQYAKQAGAIQEESDAKVNQVLARMKAELNAHNLPLSSVDQLRSAYHQEIKRAKSDAMAKVKEAAGL